MKMHRLSFCFVLSASVLLAISTAFGQGANSNATATCNFDSSKQVAVEYQHVTFDVKKKVLGKKIPYGKVWTPGGKPMTMFTNTPLTVVGKDVPIGAYTLFVIPEEKSWTLIISRSTDRSGKYHEQQDLARIPMQSGELPSSEPQFSVYFAHVAADQCSMRLDVDTARSWIAVSEKK